VTALLGRDDVRLLTLLGPPGTGKTRLGLKVAEQKAAQTAGGVTVVFLGDTTDKDMVLREVANALGLVGGASEALMESLKALLREKQTLLVLDNFEQVMGAGYVLGRLLDACPDLKIMVMSRTALDVYGEHLFAVRGMTLPPVDVDLMPEMAGAYEAIMLFEQRSRAVNSAFRLTEDNAPVVAEICRRLDGLPLAIELAAARSKILDPGQILVRLGSRLDLLTGGAADLPGRQRSLRAAIDWSYELLNEAERRAFCRMSVFPGPVTLDAIEAVCGEGLPALDVVGSLFSKSLVHRIEGEGEVRYYLLGTIREYAHERLVQSGEQHEAAERYALYCDGLIQSERNLLGRLR
jgi:predicted ATPase